MTPEVADRALAFLERVDLKGREVPVFSKVVAELVEIRDMSKPTDPPAPPAPPTPPAKPRRGKRVPASKGKKA